MNFLMGKNGRVLSTKQKPSAQAMAGGFLVGGDGVGILYKDFDKEIFMGFLLAAMLHLSQAPSNWLYLGKAVTGEVINLDLNSIKPDRAGKGFWFVYIIGTDKQYTYTVCDGRFQVAEANGVSYGPFMQPKSRATAKMLDLVCR